MNKVNILTNFYNFKPIKIEPIHCYESAIDEIVTSSNKSQNRQYDKSNASSTIQATIQHPTQLSTKKAIPAKLRIPSLNLFSPAATSFLTITLHFLSPLPSSCLTSAP